MEDFGDVHSLGWDRRRVADMAVAGRVACKVGYCRASGGQHQAWGRTSEEDALVLGHQGHLVERGCNSVP
jgi:hypothetical protein